MKYKSKSKILNAVADKKSNIITDKTINAERNWNIIAKENMNIVDDKIIDADKRQEIMASK